MLEPQPGDVVLAPNLPPQYRNSARRQVLRSRLLWIAASLLVFMVLAPLLVVALSWVSDQTETWQHLIATQLSTLLRNTVVLLLGVGTGVTLIGVSLAWLVSMCEFRGRRYFEFALMLPLAVPAYVLAFVSLGLLDSTGPLQFWLSRNVDGFQVVDIRSEFTVIAVLTLVLYPYVYMLGRSAFLSQSSDTIEAARVLGCSYWQAFFKVALPMARPAIIAGLSLALMETLADFGTVAVFNYDTFTTAIYKSWFGFFKLQAAAQLASLLLLFVALTLFAERYSRGRRGFVQGHRLMSRHRLPLSGWRHHSAVIYCVLVLAIAFVIPVIQLLLWSVEQGASQWDARFSRLLYHSLWLAAVAAVITVTAALLLAFARRAANGWRKHFLEITQLGYALPGSVLAVGVVISFAWLEQRFVQPMQSLFGLEPRQVLVGSLATLLAAYWIRFLAVATGPVQSSLERIRPSLPEAAATFGVTGWAQFRKITLPMLRPGLLTALVLVFVDVMKEMPATLLLRPYGWDTLAVRIYELTSEGEWQRAALPALMIVALGLLPVIVGVRKTTQQ